MVVPRRGPRSDSRTNSPVHSLSAELHWNEAWTLVCGPQEHQDYEVVQSSQPELNKAVVRVTVFHEEHRQVVQWVHPGDSHLLGQAELLVVDEAAAIPLPLVQKLLGPYLVFLSSTVNG